MPFDPAAFKAAVNALLDDAATAVADDQLAAQTRLDLLLAGADADAQTIADLSQRIYDLEHPKPVERVVWSLNLDTTVAKNARLSIVNTAEGRALRHLLPKDIWGTPTAQTIRMSEKLQRAKFTLKFALRTPPGTSWPWGPLGGKLPGLAGSLDGVSLGIAAGGDYPGDKAWSGRAMFKQNGGVESYMYGPLQPSRTKPPGAQYGEGIGWAGAKLVTDRVMTLEQEYILNTPSLTGAVTDGRLITSLDGTPFLDRPYTYRTRADLAITSVMWSVFAGGADKNWAAPVDRYVDVYAATVTTPA